ncbi:MAG TPA: TonB-dependent receptor [Candidatus Alistipes intestinipullorum]|nr:TonB-dependent receptor [Candidatus Alistipes intestinipullorum]
MKKNRQDRSKNNGLYRFFKTIAAVIVSISATMGALAQQGQPGTVTGKVLDSNNQPIVGASVVVVGTVTGTTTGIDGAFELRAAEGQQLEVSFIGMSTEHVPVSFNPITVVLTEESTLIDEAVVIGYGTAKKRDLTGSIVNVDAEDIANRPSSNPLASLQGRVAGVQITNTGRAGQDPEIRIRGTNSINGYAPLYVVDGLFTDNINFLNANDIDSFEILKDPSSLAIFGVRGANGVIIITTKRAKEGQTIVNVNQSIGIKHVGHRLSLTNAAQFRELYNEQLSNMGSDPFDYTNYSANTDWQDAIFQNAVISQTTASISSSDERNNFYLGVGYTYEQGNILNEEMQKVTVNFSDDYKMNNWLKFGVQMNGAYMMPADAKSVTGAIHAAPISPIYAENGDYYKLPSFQNAQISNPMVAIEEFAAHNKAQNYRFAGNVYGEINFLPELKFRAAFSLDYASDNSRMFSPVTYEYDPATGETSPRSQVESLSQTKSNTLNAQQDYTLTYTNTFAEKHNLTLMAGLTTNYTSYESLTAGRSQNINSADIAIPNDPDKWWISSIGDSSSATNGGGQYRKFTMSYLFRALYNYDNRYLLNASFRRDGASVFKYTGNTWDNFYSVGAGWIVSEENFMRNQDVIDYLKVKGSYGVLGNQNIGSAGGNYPAFPTLNASNAVFGDNIISSYSQAYLATNLRWEKTKAWEVGLEIQMLDQRLRIEPTYYSKKTEDLICYLESFMGAQDGLINAGSLRNRGFELSGSWSDKIGKDFRYTLSGNLTTIDNKVLSLGKTYYEGDKSIAVSEAGRPIGYFYGYVVEGVYQNAADIAASPTNTLATAAPGDLKFKDIDNDGKITSADRTMIGNPTPDFTYGYSLNLQYKNFDLGIDFQGVYGNEIYNTGFLSAYAQYNYNTKRMGRWNGEGTSNWEPILDSSRSLQMENSSYYIEDGSYLRLKNIQIGYSFNERLLKKIRVKALRLFFNIDNLKTWAHNTGYTPEIGGSALAFGIDSGSTYPMPSTYTFGVNVSF